MIKRQYDDVTRYFTTDNPAEIAFTCKDLGLNFNNAKIVYQPDTQLWYIFI